MSDNQHCHSESSYAGMCDITEMEPWDNKGKDYDAYVIAVHKYWGRG